MVINSQHNSTDVASSLVAGVMGTLLALALVLALDLVLALVTSPSPSPSSGRKEANEGIGLVKEYGDK